MAGPRRRTFGEPPSIARWRGAAEAIRRDVAAALFVATFADRSLTQDEWEKAWAAEIDRRVSEIREGKAELIEGDETLKRVRAGLKPTRRK
jgi:hypothetical protein